MTHAARKSIAATALLLLLILFTAAGAYAEDADQWTVIRIVEPTCTDYGYTIYEKYLSPGIRENRDYVPPLGHSWGDWETQTAPTCTESGTQMRVCQRCGEQDSNTRSIDPLGHRPVILPAKDPTCTEPGRTLGSVCAVCGAVLTEQVEIPALGHDWDEGVITALPSCTYQGVKTYTCSRCGQLRREAIPKLEHTVEITPRQEPTCTQPGLTEGSVCTVCGTVLTEQTVLPALGHDWDEGRTTREASCTQEGEFVTTCARCGETDVRILPITSHTIVTVPRKEATCTEPGLTEGKYCSVCGEVLAEQTDIPALGHLWDGGKADPEATCGADGVLITTCQRCGEAYTEVLPATGEHSFGQWVTYRPGTCESPDSQQRVCGVCGLREYRDGNYGYHAWDEGTVTVEPTLLTSGVFTYTCRNNATHTKTETIPPLDSGSTISLRSYRKEGLPYNGGLTVTDQPQGGPAEQPGVSGWTLRAAVSGGTEPYTYQWYCEEKTPLSGSVLGETMRQAADSLSALLTERRGALAAWAKEALDQEADRLFALKDQEPPIRLGLNSQPIPGADSASYTARKGSCYYYCEITDAEGNRVFTQPAFVYDALSIAAQPQQVNMYPEQSATLRVKAQGGLEPYTYCWYMVDAEQLSSPRALPEAAEDTLTAPRYLAAAYRYFCVITDAAGAEVQSEAALVYYAEPLEFAAFSQDAILQSGESVKLQARAKGGMKPYAFQWQLDGEPVDEADTDGAGAILTATVPGEYTCTVTDALGEKVSQSVTVTQQP